MGELPLPPCFTNVVGVVIIKQNNGHCTIDETKPQWHLGGGTGHLFLEHTVQNGVIIMRAQELS